MDESDALIERASARIGSVLRGKYVLDRVLGIGGMATVYAATHRNAKRFAVKMLHPELSLNPAVRTRFLREGYVANKIEHPGAVDVLDDDMTEDGSAFLVMELLEGCTVEQMANAVGGRISLEAAVAMAYQLLDILAAAHERSIVHRDVKPANLFVLPDGTLKVLDFGIARLRDAASSGAMTTGTGVLGTPAFMAPEQALSSSEVDGRTDVYAVGATVFMLVSGKPVHEGGNAQEMIVRAATKQARSLAVVLPGAPAPLVAVIDKALAFDRNDRWESATAMRKAIGDACKRSFGAAPAPETLAALVRRATGPAARAAQSQATVLEPIAPTPVEAKKPSAPPAPADEAKTGPARADDAGPSAPEPVAAEPREEPTRRAAEVTTGAGVATSPALDVSREPAGPAPPPPRRSMLAPVLAAAALLAVGALVLVRNADRTNAGAPVASTPPSSSSAAAAPPPSSGSPSTPAAAAAITLPPPRHRCAADADAGCGPGTVAWCDADDRSIACCARDLVATGRDGICACPPGGVPADAGTSGCPRSALAEGVAVAGAEAAIAALRPRLRRCYERAIVANASPGGRMIVQVDLTPEGRVYRARIAEGRMASAEVQSCSLEALRTLQTPPPAGGAATLRIPIEFTPAAPAP